MPEGKVRRGRSAEPLFTANRLALLAKLDRRTVEKRLMAVAPAKEDGKDRSYYLRDALPALCQSNEQNEAAGSIAKSKDREPSSFFLSPLFHEAFPFDYPSCGKTLQFGLSIGVALNSHSWVKTLEFLSNLFREFWIPNLRFPEYVMHPVFAFLSIIRVHIHKEVSHLRAAPVAHRNRVQNIESRPQNHHFWLLREIERSARYPLG